MTLENCSNAAGSCFSALIRALTLTMRPLRAEGFPTGGLGTGSSSFGTMELLCRFMIMDLPWWKPLGHLYVL